MTKGAAVKRSVLALVLCLHAVAPAAADEADDRLARQLAEAMRDPRLALASRVAAARTLGNLGPRAAAAVPELSAQLLRLRGAELESLQEAVIEALGQIGAPARAALPALARAAGRSTDIEQALKRSVPQIISAPESLEVALLIEQLKSRDESLRLRAAKALGKLRAKAAVPGLTAALADADGDVRRAAIAALRQIQPDIPASEDVIRAYTTDLRDPDGAVRLLAVRALGRLGTAAQPAVPAIEALLNDPERDVRRAVLDALNRINPP